jgi:hypothetical protein
LFSHLSKNVKIRLYKTIVLLVVWYGCETWSLALSEEHRQGEIEDRLLRRKSGPRRDEMTGGWEIYIKTKNISGFLFLIYRST